MKDYNYRESTDKDFSFINQMLLEVLSDTNPHDSSGQILAKVDFKNRIAGIIVDTTDHLPIGAA